MSRNLLLSLVNIIAAAEGRSWLMKVPVEPRRMLVFIAAELHAGRQVCIGDILSHGGFGAPTTASKRLRELEAGGWVEIRQDPGNHRRRLVGLTPISKEVFEFASLKLVQELKSAGLMGPKASGA